MGMGPKSAGNCLVSGVTVTLGLWDSTEATLEPGKWAMKAGLESRAAGSRLGSRCWPGTGEGLEARSMGATLKPGAVYAHL